MTAVPAANGRRTVNHRLAAASLNVIWITVESGTRRQ